MQIQLIKQQVRQFAGKHTSIVAAYVFGSRATNKNQTHSDLDLAIMTTNSISAEKRISWETLLSDATGMDVDLVIFKQAGTLLQHQILKYGKLIFERDTITRVKQEVRSRADYLDTRHLYKKIAI